MKFEHRVANPRFKRLSRLRDTQVEAFDLFEQVTTELDDQAWLAVMMELYEDNETGLRKQLEGRARWGAAAERRIEERNERREARKTRLERERST